MNIKGIHKTSLIDFPGTISTVLFTGGCNFRCKYCYNSDLAYDSDSLSTIQESEILKFLESRKGLIEGVTISGGEPLLCNGLLNFVKKIKALGLKIKIDSNGYFPEKLKPFIDSNLIDYLAIDIKTSPSKYIELTGVNMDFDKILKSINMAKKGNVNFEIRTTCIPYYVTIEDLEEIKEKIGKVDKYYIQQFINENTLDQKFNLIHPYKKEVLYEFKNFIKTFATTCEIRGI